MRACSASAMTLSPAGVVNVHQARNFRPKVGSTRAAVGAALAACVAFAAVSSPVVVSGDEGSTTARSDTERFLGPNVPWHEPRDRGVDVQDMQLQVTIDPGAATVAGVVELRGKVVRAGAPLILYAADLDIRKAAWLSAQGKETPVSVHVQGDKIQLKTPSAAAGAAFALRIQYTATPKQGMYFVGPDKDEPDRPLHFHTQGEAIEARHWIPCPDDPDERFTWTVSITAPKRMQTLSNGELQSDTTKKRSRTTVWRLDKPHPIYLLSVVGGPLVETVHRKSPVRISTWSFAKHADRVAHNSRYLPKMMDFFNKITGLPYPFSSYGQVFVHEFNSGGMENVTLTTLTHRAMGDARSDLDRTVDGLLAHELAHQWFGDVVTCRTWGDIWLNESFATFYQKLFSQHHYGEDRFAEEMAGARSSAFSTDDKRYLRPIVSDRYKTPDEVFDTNSYPKGAWVLHMLRHKLGADVFDRAIAAYLQQHQFKSVETADLRRVLEAHSQQSLRGFFTRWLRQAGHPKIEVNLRWDEGKKRLHIELKQTQKVTAQMPLYSLPVEIAVRTSTGSKVAQLHTILLDKKRASLSIAAPQRPAVVEVDPKMKLLAAWRFRAGPDVLAAAARFGRHPDVRFRATHALRRGGLRSPSAVKLLLEILAKDPARHVRAKAAKVLGGGVRKDVRAALLKAAKEDAEAVVRRAAAESLGRLYDEASLPSLLALARDDKSPRVRLTSLQAADRIAPEKARKTVVSALKWPSFRDRLQVGALTILAKRGDVADLPAIAAAAAAGQPKSVRAGAAYALAAIAVRQDHKPTRARARQALEAMLQSPTLRIRHAAASALGTLGDPASRGALMAAARREQTARWAERIRHQAKGLGKSASANERLKKIEDTLRELQKRDGGEHKHKSR